MGSEIELIFQINDLLSAILNKYDPNLKNGPLALINAPQTFRFNFQDGESPEEERPIGMKLFSTDLVNEKN